MEMTLEQAKDMAARLVKHSCDQGSPVAMEVVKTKKEINVQPFGMHALFKSHKLLHVEPIPEQFRKV